MIYRGMLRDALHGIDEAIPGVRDQLDIVGLRCGLLSFHLFTIARRGDRYSRPALRYPNGCQPTLGANKMEIV